MIIDTHVHYNLEPLYGEKNTQEMINVQEEMNDAQEKGIPLSTTFVNGKLHKVLPLWINHWKKSQEAGVVKSIVVSTEFNSCYKAARIAKQEEHLFFSMGVHPTEVSIGDITRVKLEEGSLEVLKLVEHYQKALEWMIELKTPKMVAIGECGLDYYRIDKAHSAELMDLQKKVFELHMHIAQEFELPLIIHVRDNEAPEVSTQGNAYWDALALLKEFDIKKFTLHCVSGPLSYVKQAVEMGGYMGFDGNITYPNAQHIRDIFKIVPAERRLLETDAPFLPPQEFRGKICEPWMISKTAEFVEKELKADADSFTKNAEKLFSI